MNNLTFLPTKEVERGMKGERRIQLSFALKVHMFYTHRVMISYEIYRLHLAYYIAGDRHAAH